MINNFYRFPFKFIEWEFYFFQIIKRKKDNPDTPWINWNNHQRLIKSYSIYTEEQLEKYKEEMINIASVTNSRIYMHPARRSKEKVQKEMLIKIAENIHSNKHSLSWLYNTCCWWKTYTEKLWIVDVDKKMNWEEYKKLMIHLGKDVQPYREDKVITHIKTKNWFHLITRPFNLKEFKEGYPDIDVHKNNPTLIYFNNKVNRFISIWYS